jgi:hypothetical protein
VRLSFDLNRGAMNVEGVGPTNAEALLFTLTFAASSRLLVPFPSVESSCDPLVGSEDTRDPGCATEGSFPAARGFSMTGWRLWTLKSRWSKLLLVSDQNSEQANTTTPRIVSPQLNAKKPGVAP